MEFEGDHNELKASGAKLLPDGRRGLRRHDWEVESRNRPIVNSLHLQQYTLSLSLYIVYMCTQIFAFLLVVCFVIKVPLCVREVEFLILVRAHNSMN